eukprot:721079-Prorocentrum_lima.AAC.1
MTSSLVGSEMCIRDRKMLEVDVAGHMERILHGSEKESCCQPLLLCSLCPVSYTHLTLPTICSV